MNLKSEPWYYDELWDEIVMQFHGGKHSIHGPNHWQRVHDFGLKIAESSGADVLVVKLFALFHDSRRENDGHDPGHGLRGAEFAKEYRDERAIRTRRRTIRKVVLYLPVAH